MSNLTEFGQSILQQQPFSRFLGAELEKLEAGSAVVTLAVKESFLQQHGYVHGGVVSYLADNALTFAGGSTFGDALTVEFKINYVKPAKAQRLRAVASVSAGGRRLATCRCDVIAENDGETPYVCAVAQGTIMALKREDA
ncbi:PaaI family thioesterase [Mangrovitalea sediminis]|uniref:PaaI family thioesterase n=1 Tax=Mangrovitalea sediminis TaxID=1982043 RepID=UPI000BE5B7CB|nr:PaaI family thioesterase [Mangrovitalea sediminis]